MRPTWRYRLPAQAHIWPRVGLGQSRLPAQAEFSRTSAETLLRRLRELEMLGRPLPARLRPRSIGYGLDADLLRNRCRHDALPVSPADPEKHPKRPSTGFPPPLALSRALRDRGAVLCFTHTNCSHAIRPRKMQSARCWSLYSLSTAFRFGQAALRGTFGQDRTFRAGGQNRARNKPQTS